MDVFFLTAAYLLRASLPSTSYTVLPTPDQLALLHGNFSESSRVHLECVLAHLFAFYGVCCHRATGVVTTEVLETSINVVDLFSPYVCGGKTGLFGNDSIGRTADSGLLNITNARGIFSIICGRFRCFFALPLH